MHWRKPERRKLMDKDDTEKLDEYLRKKEPWRYEE